MIAAAIFDMDGLLIDSEPLWKRAELEVFGSVNVPLTEPMCEETMGLRIDAIVQHWFDRFPWTNKTPRLVQQELTERVAQLITDEGHALPGVESVITLLAKRGLPLALCSSSPRRLIDAAVARLGLASQLSVLHSADYEPFGKPHPAAYLSVARLLDVAPRDCLVFEDSLTGAVSAKAARMHVVAVPSSQPHRFAFCDAQLTSLTEFTPALFEQLNRR